MKKAIIFDVDGTLWDSTDSIAHSYNETIRKLKLKSSSITQELIRSFMGYLREEIADLVFPEYPQQKRLEYIDICMQEECNHLLHHPGELYEGVEEGLKSLYKTYDLYIISNCQDGYIEALFSAYDIEKYFKDYECSGRTGLKKGDNIKLIMKRNALYDAVYIGDTLKDKQASKEAGINFIYAAYGFGDVSDYQPTICKFCELLSLL